MSKIIYAEQYPYWATTVPPSKSKGEVEELLNDFGVDRISTESGDLNGKLAWLIRFQLNGRGCHFAFFPFPCLNPTKESSFGGKKRKHIDQANWQMGRVAVNQVKAILVAAEAHPHVLFGFLEIPSSGGQGVPKTAGELDIEGVISALPNMQYLLNG